MLFNSGKMLSFVIISILCYSTTADSQNELPCGKNCTCTYSWDGEVKIKAECSLKGLSAVPLDLPSKITDLNLSWNNINLQSSPNLSMCKAYVNLSTLSFAWNNIRWLSPVFEDCNKLIELDLTGNVLENVNSKTFQGLGSLKQMKGLEVKDIDADTFKSLSSLDSLNLSYHDNIPNLLMFKDLNLLTELELYFEKMAHPDAKFFHFEKNNTLKILKLNSPLVKVFPPELLKELKSLEYFRLTAPGLYIFNLPKEGKPLQLKKLEILNVRKITPDLLNGFTQLEVLRLYRIRNAEVLILSPSVKELEVVECFLKMFPQNWLFSLASLEKLSLIGNPIENFDPKDFSNMKSIKYLDLSGTLISELPSNFLEPLKQSLQQFVMGHCDLRKLNHSAISNMLALEVIDLSYNFIEIIEEGNFKNMPHLTTLNLQNNYLQPNSVSEDWYSTSPKLGEINLSYNNLNGFPETLLGANLSILGLKGSNITTVPVRSLCDMGSLSKLDLEDNPVRCDKYMEMLLGCLPGIQVIGNCETPFIVQSCRISELTSCLSKSGTSSHALPPLVTETSTIELTSSSTKKWLMGMVQEETDATAIIRPIVTLPFSLTEAMDDKLLDKTTEPSSQVKNSHVDGLNSLDNTFTKKVALAEEVNDLSIQPAANDEVNNVTTESLHLVTANSTIQSEIKKPLTQLDNIQDKNKMNYSNKTGIESLGLVNQSNIIEKHLSNVSSEIEFNKTEIEAMEQVNQSNIIEKHLSNVSSEIEFNKTEIEAMEQVNQSNIIEKHLSNVSSEIEFNKTEIEAMEQVNQSNIIEKHLSNVSSEIEFNKTEIEAMEQVNQSHSIEKSLNNVSLGIMSDLMSNKSLISNKTSSGSHVENNRESSLTLQSDTSKVNSTQSVLEKQTVLVLRNDLSNDSSINNIPVQRNENTNDSISEENDSFVALLTSNVTEQVNGVKYDYEGKPSFDIESLNLTNGMPIKQLSDATQESTSTSEVSNISLNPTVKDELILKNDTEAGDSKDHLIQPAKSTYKPENEMKNTFTESGSKPTPDYRDSDPWLSPDIWTPERVLDDFNSIQTKLPESIDSLPDSTKKVLKPVYIKAAKPKEEETYASLNSLVATAVVVVVLLSILGGGFWWFKKYWQTGTYNAAATSGYQGHVDEVNISLSSMNKLPVA